MALVRPPARTCAAADRGTPWRGLRPSRRPALLLRVLLLRSYSCCALLLLLLKQLLLLDVVQLLRLLRRMLLVGQQRRLGRSARRGLPLMVARHLAVRRRRVQDRMG